MGNLLIKPSDIDTLSKEAPRHQGKEKFLKGPIPWNWLIKACKCSKSGAPIRTALAIWFLVGVNKNQATVKLSGARMRELGLNPPSWRRGLIALERAGLITVDRKTGCLPTVTLLNAGESDESDK
jgi:hypothetical protein